MDRLIEPISTKYIDGNPKSPIIEDYSPLGEYMNFKSLNVLGWKIVSKDNHNIPLNLHHGGKHYNPVTIAHHGLELYSLMLSNGNSQCSNFSNIAKWAIDNQNADGGWPFTFDHMFFKDRVDPLKAPWYSALSQGMMISLLVRNSKFSNNMEDYVNLSMKIIEKKVEMGGSLRNNIDGLNFYEEYPTSPPSYVLNGFMFCLVGLYDASVIFKNNKALYLFQSGLDTLERLLPLYDLGSGTSYDLTHYFSMVEGPNQARNSYHRLHISLLSLLSLVSENRFTRVVSRWDSYLKGNRLSTN